MKFDLRSLEDVIPGSSLEHIRWSYGVDEMTIVYVSLSDIMLLAGLQDALIILERYGTKEHQLEFMTSIIIDCYEEKMFRKHIKTITQTCDMNKVIEILKAKDFDALGINVASSSVIPELLSIIKEVHENKNNSYLKIGSRMICFMHHLVRYLEKFNKEDFNLFCRSIINLIDKEENN